MSIKNYVDHAFAENLSEMRDALHLALSEKVMKALEDRKFEVAKKMMEKKPCEEGVSGC